MQTKAWVAFGAVLEAGEAEAALQKTRVFTVTEQLDAVNAELADVGAVLLRSGDRRAGLVTWVLAARGTVVEVEPGLPAQLTLADLSKLTDPHPNRPFLEAARVLGLRSVAPDKMIRAAVLLGVWEP